MNGHGNIYRGEVVHKRVRPVEHKLRYSVFSLAVDIDHLEQISNSLRLFKVNRFSLFSLHEKDHGFRSQASLSDFAWAQVHQAGLRDKVTKIVMLFYPRILGFAFNPLTVYFCLNEGGLPEMMIYEVRNTFGENLTYVLPAGKIHGKTFNHSIEKSFYVSPYNDVEGDYTFHVTRPDDEITVGVALKTDGQPVLRTHFRGKSSELSDKNLVKVFFAYPLMTAKIVAGIHWEALKLWRKGMRLKTRPPAPPQTIIHGADFNRSV